MRKIIDGKMYNTETAKKIDSFNNGCGWGDLHYLSETLYRKRTGEFFIYGIGGAGTRYSSRVDQNSWAGGEEIIPFTEKEAREWLEAHADADVYISVFGEPDE